MGRTNCQDFSQKSFSTHAELIPLPGERGSNQSICSTIRFLLLLCLLSAIDVNGGLTYKEARLLTAGIVPGEPGRILSQVARLSPVDRDLTARAIAAARTEDIRAAREVAQRVQY